MLHGPPGPDAVAALSILSVACGAGGSGSASARRGGAEAGYAAPEAFVFVTGDAHTEAQNQVASHCPRLDAMAIDLVTQMFSIRPASMEDVAAWLAAAP